VIHLSPHLSGEERGTQEIFCLQVPGSISAENMLTQIHMDLIKWTLKRGLKITVSSNKSNLNQCIDYSVLTLFHLYTWFLVFGLLFHHTVSDSITSETHTSGAQ